MCARAMGFCAGHNTASLPLCCGRWHPGMTLVPLTHPTGHPPVQGLPKLCRFLVLLPPNDNKTDETYGNC